MVLELRDYSLDDCVDGGIRDGCFAWLLGWCAACDFGVGVVALLVVLNVLLWLKLWLSLLLRFVFYGGLDGLEVTALSGTRWMLLVAVCAFWFGRLAVLVVVAASAFEADSLAGALHGCVPSLLAVVALRYCFGRFSSVVCEPYLDSVCDGCDVGLVGACFDFDERGWFVAVARCNPLRVCEALFS